MKIHAALVSGLLLVSGCASTGIGGSKGAAVSLTPSGQGGAKVAKTIISAMGGGLVGGRIGAGLTDREKRSGLEAEYKALEYTASGQTITWKSDSSSRYGEVVAAQPYRVGSQDCRQYTHTVYGVGPAATARGTACRNPDGSWTPLT
jgi:surface antigen